MLLVGLAAAIALLLVHRSPLASSTASAPVSDHAAATWPAHTLRAPSFSLIDQTGAPFSLASYRGRNVIVTFIDPLCRDYCPIEARHLADVVRRLPAGLRPAIVAVSVNVRGNAKRTLATASAKWHVAPQWRWGVGDASRLARVWKRYHIGVLETTKKAGGVVRHDVVHTEASYLIDPNGYQRAIFLWPYSAAAVVTAIRSLAPSP